MGSGKDESRPKSSRRWLTAGVVLLALASVAAIGRAILPSVVRDYVNRTLDQNPLYSGRIGAVQMHLWRGAYSIHDIRVSKKTGDVPVPFFSGKRVDFALQWRALLRRSLEGRVHFEQPELNFVDAPAEEGTQTGSGGPWLEIIQDLFPFTINRAVIEKGAVHFRTYKTKEPVDVYLSRLQATIDNLSNISGETSSLAATVQAAAVAMDQAKLEFKMMLDPFSYRPTFHMAVRLLGLDVTKINDLARAYGKFDFERGWFDLVLEADAKEGRLTGYVKPLFRDLKIFSLSEDIKDDNVLQFFWQALVGGTTRVLKNHPRDQFGTLIPFSGDLSQSTSADILAAIGNILRNAFVRAYLPRLQSGQDVVEGLEFGAPDFAEALSSANVAQ